jgi:hypothetical protein
MTDSKSLSERLREFSVVVYNPDGSQGAFHPPICTEAADALDALRNMDTKVLEDLDRATRNRGARVAT